MSDCSNACPGSWKASRWAGNHTCSARATEQARTFKVFSHSASSVLYDDMVGPEGKLESRAPTMGGPRTKVWTPGRWLEGWGPHYNFRDETPSPAPKTSPTTSPPHYWAARKRRRKEKRRMRRSKVEPEDADIEVILYIFYLE